MKLYNIAFRRDGKLITWQRWARDEREARESLQKVLDWDYSDETCEIINIEATGQTYTRREK